MLVQHHETGDHRSTGQVDHLGKFDELRKQRGLFPYNKTGADLDAFVKERVGFYRTLATDFGLTKQ
jgi:tripartite-type tricarboxylate transporter receptor subunit TctC